MLAGKALVLSGLVGGSIMGCKFIYNEKESHARLPSNRIDMGDKSKKKAVVIGK